MPGPEASALRRAASLLRPRELRARPHRCPLCGPGLLLRLADDELAVRCLRCRASAVHLSLAAVLRRACPDLPARRVLELSARGPLANWLHAQAAAFTGSEYFEDVPRGSQRAGIRCEDVQRLTFADASFDLVTHTEVFEHVADDAAGFAELHRVLAPGGCSVFTVPLDRTASTRERARLRDGSVEHVLPPAYHGDRWRGDGKVLVFRDYGADIVDRLRAAGFARAWIEAPSTAWWGHARAVVVAAKA